MTTSILRNLKGLTTRCRTLVVLIVVIGGILEMRAQIPIRHSIVEPERPDSVDSVSYYGKKHFWRAGAEVVGLNLGLWGYDRFIQHGDFAYISFKTIRDNFKEGFKWDNDKLGTNTFLHPYNGNLYFNAARSNGYNFWQSELFSIGGSGMWEMFMEREYPSTNDIIATPIGGAALGEVLFRASDALIDERATGTERFERELGAFILSPMRGFNRLITGKMWKHSPTTGRIFGTPNISIRVSTGVKVLQFGGHLRDSRVGFASQIDVEYGDRFEPKSTKPYDYFTIRGEFQIMKSQPFLAKLKVKGRLLSREILESKRTFGSIGLYQHFDFYDSDTIRRVRRVPYKLGIPACLGMGVLIRDIERRRGIIDGYCHANVIMLGSILSDHYQTDERNYNWASGFSIKAGLNWVLHKNKTSLSIKHEYYRLFTWHGYKYGTNLKDVDYRTLNVQGDASVASFNVTEARVDVRMIHRLYFTLGFFNYVRSTHYRDFGHIFSSSRNVRVMLTYKL